MKKLTLVFPLLFSTLFLVGCACVGDNEFAENFSSRIGIEESPPVTSPEITLAEPNTHGSMVLALEDEGVRIIGTSTFNTHGYDLCKGHMKKVAKENGADYVIGSREFDYEDRQIVTVQQYFPGPSYFINGIWISSPGYWAPVQREVVRQYYDYRATFLRMKDEDRAKKKPFLGGIFK